MNMKIKRHRRPTPIYRESGYQKRIPQVTAGEQLLWLVATALLLVTLDIILVAQLQIDFVERYYSMGFYQIWAGFISSITSGLHFSLAEFIIITLGIVCIAAVVILIVRLVRGSGNRIKIVQRFFMRVFSAITVVLLLFTLGGGLNYYRHSFTAYSGLTVRPSEVTQLADLCSELAAQANTLRAGLDEDVAGVVTYQPNTLWDISQKANSSYTALTEQSPQWKQLFSLAERVPPKPVFFSEAMSYMQIVGFFFPYTIEANVNVHTSDFDIPNTMCHELAHIAGFMREDEANFISYLACSASDDAFFRYSGTMLALVHSTNALYGYSVDLYNQAMAELSPAVVRDMADDAQYYQQHMSKFGDFANNVNDTYLKINDQRDGIAGYGRMVDLLLADFRSRHSLA